METASEEELLKNPDWLRSLQYYLYKRQFTEAFLAQTLEYYDSWVCLRTQQGLSPYFCYRWLYDNDTDSADDWTDCNDIAAYFRRTQPHVTKEELEAAFKKAIADRMAAMTSGFIGTTA